MATPNESNQENDLSDLFGIRIGRSNKTYVIDGLKRYSFINRGKTSNIKDTPKNSDRYVTDFKVKQIAKDNTYPIVKDNTRLKYGKEMTITTEIERVLPTIPIDAVNVPLIYHSIPLNDPIIPLDPPIIRYHPLKRKPAETKIYFLIPAVVSFVVCASVVTIIGGVRGGSGNLNSLRNIWINLIKISIIQRASKLITIYLIYDLS